MTSKVTKEALCYDDVLIVPKYSGIKSRSTCDTSVESFLNYSYIFSMRIPILSANMSTITGPKMAIKMARLGGAGILHRSIPIRELREILSDFERIRFSPIVAVGGLDTDKERIDLVIDNFKFSCGFTIICVDIAHGHSINMVNTLKYIRSRSKDILIIAGNVATPLGANCLYENGANIVKVGIGPGSVCTTRVKTGCGYPQLQAILDIKQAHPGIPIIADGGIKNPGDAAKALAAGAELIMIGGMLAGTDCVPGWDEANSKAVTNISNVGNGVYSAQSVPEHGVKFIDFRGMASEEEKILSGKDYNNAEGVSTKVLAQPPGSTEKVINTLVEGIKSSMSYVGASNLREFVLNTEFVKVTSNTIIENSPHKLING